MARRLSWHLFLAALLTFLLSQGGLVGLASLGLALEKVRLGTATKVGATSYLSILIAERRGFWKENGLEVEWVPFEGAAALMRAVAAGELNIGMGGSETPMAAAEKGVPVIMAAEYISKVPYYIWVRTDSPYRQIQDLKGVKIGVTTLGGTTHAFGRLMLKSHGLEKDVRFVGAGGVVQAFAGLRAGAYQALVTGGGVTIKLKLEGLIRDIASTLDYLPKPWVQHVVFVRKEYARGKPDLVRKVLKATLQATDYIEKNSRWTIDLMKSFQRLSDEEAKLVYEGYQFSATGKIEPKGVENARRLYIEYGILTEKAPAAEELFTNEYLPS